MSRMDERHDPAPLADLLESVDDLRARARQARGAEERRASVWRRSTEAVLGRSAEPGREFDAQLVEVLALCAQQLARMEQTCVRLEARNSELTAARDRLGARLDDEALRRREADAERARRDRLLRKEADALRAAVEDAATRLDGLAGEV